VKGAKQSNRGTGTDN